MTAHDIRRRSLLGLSLAAAAATQCRAAAQIALAMPMTADMPTILVAGPADSPVAHWARLLRAPLAQGLGAPDELQLRFAGGRDGVTGVNQFDARAMPDGAQAVLFPGSVGLALLAGDSRVRFDARHLVPVLACAASGIMALPGGGIAPRPRPVRLAITPAHAPDAAALLALDLLNVPVLPVHVAGDKLDAVRVGAADAVFVSGQDQGARLAALAQFGIAPAFSINPPVAGAPDRRPGLPDMADLLQTRHRADPLAGAWDGLATAGLMEFVLAIPRQSPAASIQRWRTACGAWLASRESAAERDNPGFHAVEGEMAAGLLAGMQVAEPARTELRAWFGARLNWRPA